KSSIESMIETGRVLRPLEEAEPAIEQLDTYESPAVLTEALRATWHAVDRTLRTLLRSDASAPDRIRLTAMSQELMSADAVMLELRRRDFVSLGLAGRVHELRQALERAESGSVRAADADNAREVVRCVIEEVHGVARRAANAAIETQEPVPAAPAEVRIGRERPRRRWNAAEMRPLVLAGAALVVLIAAVAAVFLLSGGSPLEDGIAAFADGRPAEAEQSFRAALQQDRDNNTARLYLARILRRDGRHEEAGQLLQAAAAHDPDDAAVRRELGYLFMDLARPEFAVQQFQRAVEIDAADPLNWVGLVQALTRSGDTNAAAEWLRRAPADAREMLRGTTP
ncbi:MAG TPA: tetratricopeptide repeat protein, partial [Longimicrobiales bacterium]|nr:tetratricopeptide repeat protein [Longimicrobiales bacterium]